MGVVTIVAQLGAQRFENVRQIFVSACFSALDMRKAAPVGAGTADYFALELRVRGRPRSRCSQGGRERWS